MRLKVGTIIAGLLLFGMTAPAFAQNVIMHVNVPFAFTAGKKLLPAGTYRVIKNDGDCCFTISGKQSAMVLTKGVESQALKHTPSLIFLQSGDEYSLMEIWSADNEWGHSVLAPLFNAKNTVAGTSKAQTVQVLAQLP